MLQRAPGNVRILEQLGGEFVLRDFKMAGDIGQDARKCSDAKGQVIRNGDMVLTVLNSCQSEMAACLAGNAITKC